MIYKILTEHSIRGPLNMSDTNCEQGEPSFTPLIICLWQIRLSRWAKPIRSDELELYLEYFDVSTACSIISNTAKYISNDIKYYWESFDDPWLEARFR